MNKPPKLDNEEQKRDLAQLYFIVGLVAGLAVAALFLAIVAVV